MSLQARQNLVARLVFQKESQRNDLLDIHATETSLIALLLELSKHFTLEVTAVRSDHRDDSDLGEHCHANGYCADVWPLRSSTPGDWMDPTEHSFQLFLTIAAGASWIHQIGLAGTADTGMNRLAAGVTCFEDEGADHIHLGAQ